MERNGKQPKKLRIKWENVSIILYIIFAIYQTIYHIQLNGLYIELGMEFILHITMLSGIYYLIKDMRKNPTNWTL